jgi:hypothetical protein
MLSICRDMRSKQYLSDAATFFYMHKVIPPSVLEEYLPRSNHVTSDSHISAGYTSCFSETYCCPAGDACTKDPAGSPACLNPSPTCSE